LKIENNHKNKVSKSFTYKLTENKSILILLIIIILAFTLYMFSLNLFPISYGPDGPYYDIHIREILRTGIPDTSDPPLIYYYLTPFVILTGNSYLGIKIGMALISALMAIPAFFLTRLFIQKLDFENDIPALLAAFLITINVYVFRMIEDFMKNLAGVFFLLCFVYFTVKWFEDIKNWKINAPLMGLFFILTFFTHVYPALIACILLVGIFLFNVIVKSIKTRKIPKIELFILIGLGLISLIIIIALIFLYPSTIINIYNRLESYLNSFISGLTGGVSVKYDQFIVNIRIYFNIPYILGLIIVLVYLYQGLKRKVKTRTDKIIQKKTFLTWMYLILAVLLFVILVIPTNMTDRIILLAFIPIGLITSLLLIYLRGILRKKFNLNKKTRILLIAGISIIFASVSLFHVINFWKTMGPNITMEQYHELNKIRKTHIDSGIVDTSGIVFVDEYHFGYWVEYIFDMEVVSTGNATASAPNYNGTILYGIYRIKTPPPPFHSPREYPWNPFLPLYNPIENNPNLLSGNLKISQPTPPPSYGIIIHSGFYFELRLLYYANGTQA